MMIYRTKESLPSGIVTISSLNTVCSAGDPTDSIVIEVVPSVAGGVVLILVLIVIWWQVHTRCRNNDYPPLIDPNAGGVEEIVNEYPDTSEGSELTSGRNSASLTKLPSSGSSCSDITVAKKDQSSNSKVKKYAEGIC